MPGAEACISPGQKCFACRRCCGLRYASQREDDAQAAQKHIAAGYRWCVDLDLEKFFDWVSPDKLMAQDRRTGQRQAVAELIGASLTAGELRRAELPGDSTEIAS